jgi:TolB-like protein
MNGNGLIAELRRRNVFRVGAAYAVVAWLLLQLADILLGNFGAPEWVFKSFVALLALGFPLALFLAWAYELTPEGVKRSTEVPPANLRRSPSERRLDAVIIGGAALVIVAVLADRFWPDRETVPAATEPEVAAALVEPPAHVVGERSIAVLPFADLSPDGDHAYFADGIAEELLNALAQVKGLRVAGRSSSFNFGHRARDLRVIGEVLGVAYVLEGSVRMSAERVRITAQLIGTADGFHLWSDTYDGEMKDIFDLQERIARSITSSLELVLDGGQERIVAVATEDSEAYNLFLQATAIFNRRDRDRLVHATELLEEAIRLDGDFTRARSRLAAVLIVSPAYAPVDQAAYLAAAERHAHAAISQDDRLAEPYAVLGLLHSNRRQYAAAHDAFQRALERDPRDVTSNFWFAIHLWMSGHRSQATHHLDVVLDIDPMLPIALNWRALAWLDAGDRAAARRLYQRAYDLGLVAAAQGLAELAQLTGDRDAAIRYLLETIQVAFAVPVTAADAEALARGIYGGAEEQRHALEVVREYLSHGPQDIHGYIPNVLMRIGEPAQALELASRAPLVNETLFFAPLWLRPVGDPARRSPAFPEFARETGLADYWMRHGPPDGCRMQRKRDFHCD